MMTPKRECRMPGFDVFVILGLPLVVGLALGV